MTTALNVYTVDVSDKTTWIWFRLMDGEGREGVGEATLNNRAKDVLSALAPAMNALCAARDLGLAGKLQALRVQTPGLVGRAIASAIEQCWLDLEGKRTGRPVHALLGGRHRSAIPCYANINRGTLSRSPQEFADRAAQAVEDGFTAIKMAPFDNVTPDAQDEAERHARLEAGMARIEAVAERLNGKGRVQVDCHSRLRAAEAPAILERLAASGVGWFEEPILETQAAFPQIAELRRLAKQHGIVLAGAEQAAGLGEFAPFCHARCYDVIMPDIILAGGPGEVVRIGHLAAALGQAVSLHNPSGPVMDMHSAHVAAAVPELHSLERQFRESPLYDDLVHRRHTFSQGVYQLGNDPGHVPGLGLSVDWQASIVAQQFATEIQL
ncbi:MAG: mandelate racemase/muconate lactonizing enzyme family protein [Hyphomicrobiaceae bacterium]